MSQTETNQTAENQTTTNPTEKKEFINEDETPITKYELDLYLDLVENFINYFDIAKANEDYEKRFLKKENFIKIINILNHELEMVDTRFNNVESTDEELNNIDSFEHIHYMHKFNDLYKNLRYFKKRLLKIKDE
jgi:hypothetical protein